MNKSSYDRTDIIKKKLLLILILALFSIVNETKCQTDASNKSNLNFEFYDFVIEEYISLIKKVEQGPAPFFVIINEIYFYDTDEQFNLSFTYTDRFDKLSQFVGSKYYVYEKEKIIVIVDELNGYKAGSQQFVDDYNLEEITRNVLEMKFYPLTKDSNFKFSDDVINVKSSEPYPSMDSFYVSRILDHIKTEKNGLDVFFLKDYKKRKIND